MRYWNIPAVNELDVRLTASSGIPSASERDGFLLPNGWNNPTYNASVYEDDGDCVIPLKAGAQS